MFRLQNYKLFIINRISITILFIFAYYYYNELL